MGKDAYIFPTAVIRTMEARLLDQNAIDRMIEADNLLDAFKIFNDLSYADELRSIEDPKDYSSVLDHDLMQLKEKLLPMIPEEEIKDIIFLRFDFHNIKLVFKEKLTGKDLSEYESRLGRIDVAKLRDFIVQGKLYVGLPEKIEYVIRETEKKIKDPDLILDAWLDKQYLLLLKDLAKRSRNSFIVTFIEKEIGLANIKTVLRAKKLKLDSQRIAGYLIDNSAVNVKVLLDAYGKDWSDLVEVCTWAFVDTKIKDAIRDFAKHQEVWSLEKEFENYEMRIIRPTKYIGYGPEIILSYFLAKKNAVRNLRLIMSGKINGLKKEEIRQRLSEIF